MTVEREDPLELDDEDLRRSVALCGHWGLGFRVIAIIVTPLTFLDENTRLLSLLSLKVKMHWLHDEATNLAGSSERFLKSPNLPDPVNPIDPLCPNCLRQHRVSGIQPCVALGPDPKRKNPKPQTSLLNMKP